MACWPRLARPAWPRTFGMGRMAHIQTSVTVATSAAEVPRPLRSRTGILLAAAWVYFVGWGILFVIGGLLYGGEWEFGSTVMTGALLIPIVSIPLYLLHCVRQQRPPRYFSWLPWVGRVVVVSILLAVCDVWVIRQDHSEPPFSRSFWKMRDGGTRGYVGFGYSLTNYRRMGGPHGPEVWFWFTPFRASWTTGHMRILLPWQSP